VLTIDPNNAEAVDGKQKTHAIQKSVLVADKDATMSTYKKKKQAVE
jgi:hypothetical protein